MARMRQAEVLLLGRDHGGKIAGLLLGRNDPDSRIYHRIGIVRLEKRPQDVQLEREGFKE